MPFDWGGQSINLSASVGIVNLSVAEEGFSAVLQAADKDPTVVVGGKVGSMGSNSVQPS